MEAELASPDAEDASQPTVYRLRLQQGHQETQRAT